MKFFNIEMKDLVADVKPYAKGDTISINNNKYVVLEVDTLDFGYKYRTKKVK